MQTLYVIMKSLLLPPGNCFFMAGGGWLLGLRRPLLGRAVIIASAVLLYSLCTPIVSGAFLRTLESAPPLSLEEEFNDVGAIVVLSAELYIGAPDFGGDTVGSLTLERLRYAALAHRATGIPILVTRGRIRRSDKTLGVAMRDTLSDEFRIPVRWVEEESRNTRENAVNSAALLLHEGVGKIILVTHAWHMPRSVAVFEAAGLTVLPGPTTFESPEPFRVTHLLPSASALGRSAFATHEWLGRAWYALRR